MIGRRGFILLFGTKPVVSDDPDTPPVAAVCPQCGLRAQIVAKRVRHWFTVFFIPLFPIGGSTRFSQCRNCGAQFPIEGRQLGTLTAAAERQQSQRSIALYNSLRNSPANAITLNELMTLHASASEFDQAIAAARDFPHALHSSEHCMTTLGRVYLAKGVIPEAIRWFDAALALNEWHDEAKQLRREAQGRGEAG